MWAQGAAGETLCFQGRLVLMGLREAGTAVPAGAVGIRAVEATLSPRPSSSPPLCWCYLHHFLPREVQEFDVTGLVSALLPGSLRELSQSSRGWDGGAGPGGEL